MTGHLRSLILGAGPRPSICYLLFKDMFQRETRKGVGKQDGEGKEAKQRCRFRASPSLISIPQ